MEKRVRVIMVVACALVCALASVNVQAANEVTVDPAQTWIGYMNVSNLPADGGAYQFGSAWGTSALQASFSGATLTLAPNINCWNASDSYWCKPGPLPNKNMDAVIYVENDALAGSTVEFTGLTLANTLVSPYTSVAFIKDFVANYSSSTSVTAPLVGGIGWDLTMATTPGDHIQYGFETIGPDADPATVASLGNAQVIPEPSSIALVIAGLSGLMMFARKRHA